MGRDAVVAVTGDIQGIDVDRRRGKMGNVVQELVVHVKRNGVGF